MMISEPGKAEDTRVSIRLSPSAKTAIEEIMKLGHFKTIQEAVRRAISDELFLQKEMSDGWRILLRRNNEYREVVWPEAR